MHNYKNKPAGKVVEFQNDWQQVGGILGNVIGNLQLQARDEPPKPSRQQQAELYAVGNEETLDLFAPRKAA